MKKNIVRKGLAVGIIILFIGLAFIPSFNAVSISKKENHPPNKPTITGPNGGRPGISYTFNFNAEDPDGDNVSYFIKWGDGTTYGWTTYTWSGINVPIAHTWDYICDCPVRAKAKDIYGKEGDWSDLIIRINRNKPQNVNVKSAEDCLECQYNGKTHLAEKLLNKLEKNEEIAEVIDLSNPKEDPPICDYILDQLWYYFDLVQYYAAQSFKYQNGSLMHIIYVSIVRMYLLITGIYLSFALLLNCDIVAYPP